MKRIMTIIRLTCTVGLCILFFKLSASGQGLIGFSDEAFVKEVAERGIAEIMLGKLGNVNAYDEQVKKFSEMLVIDHQKVNEELKQLAQRKNIFIPAGIPVPMQKDLDEIAQKNADDFDDAFMKKMIRDHEATILLFKRATEKAVDRDLRSWAVKTLPTLERHLEHAKNIRDSLKDKANNLKKSK